jgi:micrococcal nuclease
VSPRGRRAAVLLPGALLLAAAACDPPPEPAVPEPTPCVVARVADGDSLTCAGGERVRLLLIDAPELGQRPYGEQAERALARLAPPGTRLRVELDREARDRFGRLLAYLWLPDGRLASEEMVRQGYAVELAYPPNLRHRDRIRAAERDARGARRGLWASWDFACPPVDYRAGRCGS